MLEAKDDQLRPILFQSVQFIPSSTMVRSLLKSVGVDPGTPESQSLDSPPGDFKTHQLQRDNSVSSCNADFWCQMKETFTMCLSSILHEHGFVRRRSVNRIPSDSNLPGINAPLSPWRTRRCLVLVVRGEVSFAWHLCQVALSQSA